MARTEARVKTSIWRDEDFLSLSPTAKLVYLSLISQPTLTLCGVVAYTPRALANSLGTGYSRVTAAVEELGRQKFVQVDGHTEEVWVRTFIKNDGVLTKPYMAIAMTKDVLCVRSKRIRTGIIDSLGPSFIDDLAERFPKVFRGEDPKRFPKPFVDMFTERFA